MFDRNGRARLTLNELFSNILTPTGLPVEYGPSSDFHFGGGRLESGPLTADGSGETVSAPFQVDVPIPVDAPEGTYALWLVRQHRPELSGS